MIVLSTFLDVILGGLVIFFVVIPIMLIWIVALADLFRQKSLSPIRRVLWLLAIIFIPIAGAILYLLLQAGHDEFGRPLSIDGTTDP